jgi:hypothetical protein
MKDSNLDIICPLCGSGSVFYFNSGKSYYRCCNCRSIFLDRKDFVSFEEEKKRYLEHNNDVSDPGYRSFVSPVTSRIFEKFTPQQRGLDFGCGTGPVISEVLKENGYKIETYDPMFCDKPDLLEKKYEYVVCCEVAEHFHNPYKEFGLLRTLLEKGGIIYIMTDFFDDRTKQDFKKWYYKDDQTHVFFYHEDAFKWIKEVFGFSQIKRFGRLVLLVA